MTESSLRWQRLAAAPGLAQADLAADWDRLNAARCDLPFMAARALRAALDAFGDGRERLLVGRRAGRVVAMFVLAPAGALRWSTFQPSQLPLGAWVAESGIDLRTTADSLLRALGGCLLLSVTQVDPRISARAADDACARHDDYVETGWLDIAGSFDDYWAARGKNLRQNMRKQRNKLVADGTATSMRVLREPAEMAEAIARYGALESAGWKSDTGTAIAVDNAQGRFYRRLLEEAAAAGEAFVTEYRFDDRVVAMNLGLLRGGQWIVLKTAYDESIKALSPAFMLREEELQRFFGGDEVRRIEYYGKVMDWHTKLTDRKRMLYHLSAYRWAWLRRLAERRRQAAVPAAAPATAAAAATPADAAR